MYFFLPFFFFFLPLRFSYCTFQQSAPLPAANLRGQSAAERSRAAAAGVHAGPVAGSMM